MTEIPIHSSGDQTWLDPANVAEFARAAEAAGVDAIALTDHPAPSDKWLHGGGHETYDPFVGLGFAAAVTSRIKLMTHLVVVPYRNPFLTAKSMTSVDVLSGGRTIFVLGTGYLRSEFAALGMPFDDRNAQFDEAIEVIRGVMAKDNFSFEGSHFKALGVTLRPTVVQKPHPPFWLGGNAKVVLQRVAKWGQGWSPLGGGEIMARTARTRALSNDDDLATLIAMLGDFLEQNGRARNDVDICASGVSGDLRKAGAAQAIDRVGALRELGCTWCSFGVPRASAGETFEALTRFGDEVIAKTR